METEVRSQDATWRLLRACLLAAAAPSALACPTAQTAASSPVPAQDKPGSTAPREEKWRLKPLVLIGSEAAETGGRFQELGAPEWLEPGYLFFWGRYGGGSDSGFFSLRDGRVSAAALGKGYGPRTAWFAGRSKVYLAQATSFSGLVSPPFPRVWDGERLTTPLTEGDAIEVGGVRYQAWWGQVSAVCGDEALIDYFTKKPTKTSVHALWDGQRVSPLLAVGGPLSGVSGVQVKRGDPVQPSVSPSLAPGALFAVLSVSGAPYESALFRLTREKADLILALGQKDPLDPTKTIASIEEIHADRPDRVAVHATVSGEQKRSWDHRVYLWENGQVRHLFVGEGSPKDGMFLSSEMPHYFFQSVTQRVISSRRILTVSWWLFDGDRLANLTSDIWSEEEPVSEEALDRGLASLASDSGVSRGGLTRRMTGVFNGILLGWVRRATPPAGEEKNPRLEPAWWFLDMTAKTLRFRTAPEFATLDGRRVLLANVRAWIRPDEAVVWLPEGYFLLSKQ